MTFADYLVQVARTQAANPDHRYGQVLFNVLYIKRPDLATKIRGGQLDPFHRDERAGEFLAFIQGAW